MIADRATHYCWSDMPLERVNDRFERRMIAAKRMTLAQVHLAAGCIVPWHAHENEQVACVVEGALRFRIGDENGEEILVRAGEVLHLPSNLPHWAEVLEDSVVLDLFSPPREDWLQGTDAYLRR